MIDAANYGFCQQFYTVEKSVEVIVSLGGEQRCVRIEALRGRDGSYSTKAYIKEELIVQPAFPQTSEKLQPSVWIGYSLPWTNRDSADGALHQALKFLEERCRD
jgi:hypothetical protein